MLVVEQPFLPTPAPAPVQCAPPRAFATKMISANMASGSTNRRRPSKPIVAAVAKAQQHENTNLDHTVPEGLSPTSTPEAHSPTLSSSTPSPQCLRKQEYFSKIELVPYYKARVEAVIRRLVANRDNMTLVSLFAWGRMTFTIKDEQTRETRELWKPKRSEALAIFAHIYQHRATLFTELAPCYDFVFEDASALRSMVGLTVPTTPDADFVGLQREFDAHWGVQKRKMCPALRQLAAVRRPLSPSMVVGMAPPLSSTSSSNMGAPTGTPAQHPSSASSPTAHDTRQSVYHPTMSTSAAVPIVPYNTSNRMMCSRPSALPGGMYPTPSMQQAHQHHPQPRPSTCSSNRSSADASHFGTSPTAQLLTGSHPPQQLESTMAQHQQPDSNALWYQHASAAGAFIPGHQFPQQQYATFLNPFDPRNNSTLHAQQNAAALLHAQLPQQQQQHHAQAVMATQTQHLQPKTLAAAAVATGQIHDSSDDAQNAAVAALLMMRKSQKYEPSAPYTQQEELLKNNMIAATSVRPLLPPQQQQQQQLATNIAPLPTADAERQPSAGCQLSPKSMSVSCSSTPLFHPYLGGATTRPRPPPGTHLSTAAHSAPLDSSNTTMHNTGHQGAPWRPW